MRILNISAQKPDSTGSGVFLAQTVRCMERAGHQAAVVCGVDDIDDPAASLPAKTAVYPVRFNTAELPFHVCGMSDVMPYASTRYRDLTPDMAWRFKTAFARMVEQAMDEMQPDFILCHHLYLATAVARTVAPDIPMGAISHSTDLRQFRQHGLERDFIREIMPTLDDVFALHDEQRDEIVDTFGIAPERVHVVGVGYDHELFSLSNARSQRKNAKSALKVLYVGKLSYPKGIMQLLDALDLLADEGVATDTVLVGGHSDAAQYDAIVKRAVLSARPPVFTGPLAPEQLAPLYRDADIFVLPSFFEGLPLVAAEALSCGCKVVMTDLPGIRDFFDKFVPGAPIFYVPPPRMHDVDVPVEEDLGEFTKALAEAMKTAAGTQWSPCGIEALSWASLTDRILSCATPMRVPCFA